MTIIQHRNGKAHPAIGRCVCGYALELTEFTNTCRCGRDYSWTGQLLDPRSRWGQDTGESLAEILALGHNDQSGGGQ